MRKSLSAPDRVALLLPWLNGDPLREAEIRRRLGVFLASFDGGPDAGGVRVLVRAWYGRATDTELARLRQSLVVLFRKGYLHEPGEPPLPKGTSLTERWPSLRFGVWPGAFRLLVDADAVADLVCFLVLHLVTVPGLVTLARCRAPRPHAWTSFCGNFIVTSGLGRPRKFCSNKCRVRMKAYEDLRATHDLSKAKFAKWLVTRDRESTRRKEKTS